MNVTLKQPVVHYTTKKAKKGVDELIELAKEPTPEHISAEQLIEEQGFDSEGLGDVVKNIDHSLFEEETLEELLNTLSK